MRNLGFFVFCIGCFIFTFLAIFSACEKTPDPVSADIVSVQVTIDTTGIPDSLLKIYRNDADQLAVFKMLASGSPLAEQVEIDRDLHHFYLNRLLAVYNATSLAARDSVVELYPIHVFGSNNLRSFIVQVDTALPWTNTWLNGQVITGNPAVDSLADKYKLQVDPIFSDWFALYSNQNWNTFALEKTFGSIAGILYSGQNGLIGGGSSIRVMDYSNYSELVYIFGYGDCPSGCINYHFWKFRVADDYTVTFLGSGGDPLP